MIPAPLEDLMKTFARIPGMGRRSAQRAALHLIPHPAVLARLQQDLATVSSQITSCPTCGNIDLVSPCHICASHKRDDRMLCVVEEVADLWAIERSGAFNGRYHVLGGLLSALDGRGPDEIGLPQLIQRIEAGSFEEVILALSAGVDGQTTSHLIAQKLLPQNLRVTTLAKGMPMGAEVDYMDEGTLHLALSGRLSLA